MSEAVEKLMDQLGCKRVRHLGRTRDVDSCAQRGRQACPHPSPFREVVDVSGAGDTVIAVASLMLASQANAVDVAAVANLAGGWW